MDIRNDFNALMEELKELPVNYQIEVKKKILSAFTTSVADVKKAYEHEINVKMCEMDGHDFGEGIFDGGWSFSVRRLHSDLGLQSVRQKIWSRKCLRCGHIESRYSTPEEIVEKQSSCNASRSI